MWLRRSKEGLVLWSDAAQMGPQEVQVAQAPPGGCPFCLQESGHTKACPVGLMSGSDDVESREGGVL